MSIPRLIAGRLLRLLTVVLAASTASFLLLNLLPGDPTLALLGPAAGDPAAVQELEDQLGLGEPLPVRYATWLGHAVQGDLGESYFTRQSVVDTILERTPLTMQITVSALALALLVAIPLATLSARKPGGWADRVIGWSMFAMIGLPPFTLGIVLIWLFAVRWQLLPASGQDTWFELGPGVIATPRSILLPVVTLAAGQIAVFTRILRSDLIATLRADFIGMARSKGIPGRQVILRHALRPSSLSLVTLAALALGGLIGGAVIVEQMFALPGMGRLIVDSIYKRDYLVVQGTVVLIATAFVLAGFVVEILYGILDPRVRGDG